MAAVRAAVPEGASTLAGWCSSMTSTDSKKGAALAAKAIMSSAPMAKFGAMSTPTPAPLLAGGASASWPRSVSSRASSQPVVPTTTCTPRSTQCATLPGDAAGTVSSTATSAPARSPRSSPEP